MSQYRLWNFAAITKMWNSVHQRLDFPLPEVTDTPGVPLINYASTLITDDTWLGSVCQLTESAVPLRNALLLIRYSTIRNVFLFRYTKKSLTLMQISVCCHLEKFTSNFKNKNYRKGKNKERKFIFGYQWLRNIVVGTALF